MISSRHAASITVATLVLFTALPGYGGTLPTWDKRIETPGRFKVLAKFDDAAVLDKETGLVWTRSPNRFLGQLNAESWDGAVTRCASQRIGVCLPSPNSPRSWAAQAKSCRKAILSWT